MNNLNYQIINLRAIAIILIVLGHSIIIYDNSFNILSTDIKMPLFETAKHYISFIQLKLFFSISGFLMCYKVIRWKNISIEKIFQDFILFIKQKSKRLIVPLIFVCVLYMDPIKILIGVKEYSFGLKLLLQQLLCINIGHLWFLPCLFNIFVIMYICLAFIRNSFIGHVILFLALIVVNYFHGRFTNIYQLNETAYYTFFFYLGYIINRISMEMKYMKVQYHINLKKFLTVHKSAILLLFIILLITSTGLIIKNITSIGFDFYLSIVVLSCFYILIPKKSNRIIKTISDYSYGIYLFHSPLIYITATFCPDINPWLMLFINFVIFGLISYMISYVLSKSPLKFIVGN